MNNIRHLQECFREEIVRIQAKQHERIARIEALLSEHYEHILRIEELLRRQIDRKLGDEQNIIIRCPVSRLKICVEQIFKQIIKYSEPTIPFVFESFASSDPTCIRWQPAPSLLIKEPRYFTPGRIENIESDLVTVCQDCGKSYETLLFLAGVTSIIFFKVFKACIYPALRKKITQREILQEEQRDAIGRIEQIFRRIRKFSFQAIPFVCGTVAHLIRTDICIPIPLRKTETVVQTVGWLSPVEKIEVKEIIDNRLICISVPKLDPVQVYTFTAGLILFLKLCVYLLRDSSQNDS